MWPDLIMDGFMEFHAMLLKKNTNIVRTTDLFSNEKLTACG